MNVELKQVTPETEKIIIEIARVSSSREDKSTQIEKLVGYLIKNKHWSPFEHGFMTLKIETSKAIGIQYLRHRSFTFQEFSQRYAKVEEIEDVEYRLQAEKNRQSSTDIIGTSLSNGFLQSNNKVANNEQIEAMMDAHHAMKTAFAAYDRMIDAGIAKECARFVLPMATKTTIYMSGTIRSWIHLIQLRDDGHAQKEAQEIAREAKKIFKAQFPIISLALDWISND